MNDSGINSFTQDYFYDRNNLLLSIVNKSEKHNLNIMTLIFNNKYRYNMYTGAYILK